MTAIYIVVVSSLVVVMAVVFWADNKVRQVEAKVSELRFDLRDQGLEARHHMRLARLWYRIAIESGEVTPHLATMVETLDPELKP